MADENLTRETEGLKNEVKDFKDKLDISKTVVTKAENAENVSIKNRTLLHILMWALGFVFVLSIGVSFLAINNWNNAKSIKETRSEVLCPLYKLFVDSYDPSRQPKDRLVEYEQAFVTIRAGSVTLGCHSVP